MTSPSCHSTFSKVTSPWTRVVASNGSSAGRQPRDQLGRLGEHARGRRGRGVRLARGRRARAASGRSAPTSSSCGAPSIGGRSGGAVVCVEGGQARGQLLDGALALASLRSGQRWASGVARAPARHEPVLAAPAAVGDDAGVADLGRQDRGDQRPRGRAGCSGGGSPAPTWVGVSHTSLVTLLARSRGTVGSSPAPRSAVRARTSASVVPFRSPCHRVLSSPIGAGRPEPSARARGSHGPIAQPRTASPERRPGVRCPGAEGLVGAAPRRPRPPSGSTHRNAPDWPKCPKVRGRAPAGVQCGDLCPRSRSRGPTGWAPVGPKPGQHPGEVGQLRRRGLGERSPGRGPGPGRGSSAAEPQQVGPRCCDAPWAGEPCQRRRTSSRAGCSTASRR